MKTLTVTSSQLEHIRAALVEQRGKLAQYLATASNTQQPTTWWQARLEEVDRLLLLVAQA